MGREEWGSIINNKCLLVKIISHRFICPPQILSIFLCSVSADTMGTCWWVCGVGVGVGHY